MRDLAGGAGHGLPPQQARRDGRAVQRQIETAPVIFTAAPVYESLAALRGGERFPQGAQLMVLRDGRMDVLVAGFRGERRCERFVRCENGVVCGEEERGRPMADLGSCGGGWGAAAGAGGSDGFDSSTVDAGAGGSSMRGGGQRDLRWRRRRWMVRVRRS